MRIFTAIPVPKTAQDAFKTISPGKLPIPYVNAENFHVTLYHLGELDSDLSRKVIAEWKAGLPTLKRFKVQMDRVDKLGHHLVIFLKDSPELREVHDAVVKRLGELGFKAPNMEFKPHITLGNMHLDNVMFRNRKAVDFPHGQLSAMDYEADRVTLFESKLLLHHPKYNILDEHMLT